MMIVIDVINELAWHEQHECHDKRKRQRHSCIYMIYAKVRT